MESEGAQVAANAALTAFIVAAMFAVLLVAAVVYIFWLRKRYNDLKERFRIETIWDPYEGELTIGTMDYGSNWWLLRVLDHGSVLIEDHLDPEVEERWKAMQEWPDYNRRRGPIGSRPLDSNDMRMLSRMGLVAQRQVQDRPPQAVPVRSTRPSAGWGRPRIFTRKWWRDLLNAEGQIQQPTRRSGSGPTNGAGTRNGGSPS